MKKYLFTAILAASVAQADAADKALATFTVGYVVGSAGYLDTLTITRATGDREYAGVTSTGLQISGVAAGNMLCMSPVKRPLYGETWCFPYKKKSPGLVATYTMTICEGSGIFQDCYGISYPAAVQKSKSSPSPQSLDPQSSSQDEQKLYEAMEKFRSH